MWCANPDDPSVFGAIDEMILLCELLFLEFFHSDDVAFFVF